MLDYVLVMPTKIEFVTIAVIFIVYSNEYIFFKENRISKEDQNLLMIYLNTIDMGKKSNNITIFHCYITMLIDNFDPFILMKIRKRKNIDFVNRFSELT